MMGNVDATYADLICSILDDGEELMTRNSVCRRMVAMQIEFNVVPLVSARKTAWKNCLREWEWFMSGSCNIWDLHEKVRSWWQPWANHIGNVPFNYSQQFRNFRGSLIGNIAVDQIALMLDGVQNHPFSRRNVITTWNTADMTHSSCPITNCHGTIIQAFVGKNNGLTLVTYQRSVDVICGLPHNWFQYWAFLMWLAYRTGRIASKLVWIGGDVHIYQAHYDLARRIADAKKQCLRTPGLVYTPTSEDFKADDFSLDKEYQPVLQDRAEMIV